MALTIALTLVVLHFLIHMVAPIVSTDTLHLRLLPYVLLLLLLPLLPLLLMLVFEVVLVLWCVANMMRCLGGTLVRHMRGRTHPAGLGILHATVIVRPGRLLSDILVVVLPLLVVLVVRYLTRRQIPTCLRRAHRRRVRRRRVVVACARLV